MRENSSFKDAIIQFLNFVIRYSKKYLLLELLFICLIFRILFFFLLIPDFLMYNSDSVTYFAPVDLLHGKLDLYRTPVYPYLIQFFTYLSKDNLIRNIVVFQQIFSFLSIIPFFYILKYTVRKPFIIILSILIYGCFPQIIVHNVNINPECLCIVGSTVFLYLFLIYNRKPRKIQAFLLGLLPLILILIKPIFLMTLPLCLLFFLIKFFDKRERKITAWGFLGLSIAIIGIWGYCEMNKKYNGEFILSKISLNNAIANIVISNAYLSGGDEELITLVNENKEKMPYVSVYLLNNEWMDQYKQSYQWFPQNLKPSWDMDFCYNVPDIVNYPNARIKEFVKKSQLSKAYIKYMAGQIKQMFFGYRILSSVLFFVIILSILAFIKYKKWIWMPIFCVLFILGQYFTIALGGIDSWARLFLPSYPFVIIILALFVDFVISSIDKEKFNQALLFL